MGVGMWAGKGREIKQHSVPWAPTVSALVPGGSGRGHALTAKCSLDLLPESPSLSETNPTAPHVCPVACGDTFRFSPLARWMANRAVHSHKPRDSVRKWLNTSFPSVGKPSCPVPSLTGFHRIVINQREGG